ncbi:MAG: hypothetical protein COB69_01645 [Phycisphaera sp.]|nr:MAG: hypothetical protein COB69_01645 [Phycisphaera sp.]
MAGRKKKKTKRELILERVSPAVVGTMLTGLILIVGMGVGMNFADDQAADIASSGPPVVRINWPTAVANGRAVNWPPAHTQKDLLDDAYAIVQQYPGPFSSRTLESLGIWLKQTGWVSSVTSIKRLDEGVIEIEAVWRSPAAVVRDGAHDYLIATDGRRLRMSWRADLSPFPTIRGALDASALAAVPGEVWPSQSVQAGLELLNLLQERLPGNLGADQVRGIEVSSFDRYKRLVLLTDEGNRIIWGRMPSDPVPDAISTEAKLNQLRYLRQHPDFGRRIDAGRKLIDISSGPVLVEDRRHGSQDSRR